MVYDLHVVKLYECIEIEDKKIQLLNLEQSQHGNFFKKKREELKTPINLEPLYQEKNTAMQILTYSFSFNVFANATNSTSY